EMPQPGIELQRMLAERSEQPLRKVDLIAVAGANVVDDFGHGGFITRAVEVAGDAGKARQRELRRANGLLPGRAGCVSSLILSWSCQYFQEFPYRRLGSFPRRVLLRITRGDNPGAPLHMIEANDPRICQSALVGKLELVDARPGDAFQLVAQSITEEPGDTALKRRQPFDPRLLEPFHAIAANSLRRHIGIAAAVAVPFGRIEKEQVGKMS